MENYFFPENYVTLEGAVSHIVLLYQNLSIACYQVSCEANNYFEIVSFKNIAARGSIPTLCILIDMFIKMFVFCRVAKNVPLTTIHTNGFNGLVHLQNL